MNLVTIPERRKAIRDSRSLVAQTMRNGEGVCRKRLVQKIASGQFATFGRRTAKAVPPAERAFCRSRRILCHQTGELQSNDLTSKGLVFRHGSFFSFITLVFRNSCNHRVLVPFASLFLYNRKPRGVSITVEGALDRLSLRGVVGRSVAQSLPFASFFEH